MKFLPITGVFLFLLLPAQSLSQAPGSGHSGHDSTIVFGSMDKPANAQSQQQTFNNSMGANLMISPSGFGLGTYYRHEYTDNFSAFIDLSISEAKDDNEEDYVDQFGNTYTPGKINRFLVLPLFVGIQQRLFSDDIVDNFRPYVTAAAGPAMIYVFPYNEEYFSALGHGSPKYTAGGYIGFGAFFGSERSNVLGLNLRYYYIPYPGGITSLQQPDGTIINKSDFGSVTIGLTFGGAW